MAKSSSFSPSAIGWFSGSNMAAKKKVVEFVSGVGFFRPTTKMHV
jgi:hypothetical protein